LPFIFVRIFGLGFTFYLKQKRREIKIQKATDEGDIHTERLEETKRETNTQRKRHI